MWEERVLRRKLLCHLQLRTRVRWKIMFVFFSFVCFVFVFLFVFFFFVCFVCFVLVCFGLVCFVLFFLLFLLLLSFLLFLLMSTILAIKAGTLDTPHSQNQCCNQIGNAMQFAWRVHNNATLKGGKGRMEIMYLKKTQNKTKQNKTKQNKTKTKTNKQKPELCTSVPTIFVQDCNSQFDFWL